MPVTINLNPEITSNPVDPSLFKPGQSSTDLLRSTAPEPSKTLESLLHSSIPSGDLPKIIPAGNGLIHACIQAYSKHHHLEIRPDDVWITILTQFSFYVNAHSEQLRGFFVPHIEGKKELHVKHGGGPVGANYGLAAEEFADLMQKDLEVGQAGWLKDWILPKFSTTTENDTAVEAILMMCTLKNYFQYFLHFHCGIPSVTLLGTKEDWVMLRERINRLLDFGEENTELYEWHELLCPVFDRFVESFNYHDSGVDPQKKKNIGDFWNVMCKRKSFGSGGGIITGWVCYLCPFTDKGQWKFCPERRTSAPDPPVTPRPSAEEPPKPNPQSSGEKLTRGQKNAIKNARQEIQDEWRTYDRNLEYFTHLQTFSELVHDTKEKFFKWQASLDTQSIPAATANCELIIDDNGNWFDAVMVAGLAGYQAFGENNDSVRPYPAWWVFKEDVEEKKEADRIVQSRKESQKAREEMMARREQIYEKNKKKRDRKKAKKQREAAENAKVDLDGVSK